MNQKGFAVSGIIYTLLVLFIILFIALLAMFNSRKNTLDKLKEKVLNQIGSNVVVEDAIYENNNQVIQHKIMAKGYYSIVLTSSNGSTLETELYLKEGEILYLRVGSQTFNNGTTEVYKNSNLSNLLLKVTNTSYDSISDYNDRTFLNTKYTKKSETISSGKITIKYIQRSRKNKDLNQVRYVKNCINGNSIDSTNKWNEIKAIVKGVNVAKGKSVKLYDSKSMEIVGDYSAIVDNNLTTFSTKSSGEMCAVIDLGRTYSLDYIYTWHEYNKDNTYYDNKLYVSAAGIEYKVIDNLESKETVNGNMVSAFDNQKVKLVGNVYVPIKQFDGATWLRLYHHNNLEGTVLWDAQAQLLMNDGYETIHKKSTLYALETFMHDDKYEFLLEYPQVSDIKYNRWTQTSNFTTSNSVSNYSAKHVDYNTIKFAGLMLCNGTNSVITTTNNINYAIGTINGTGGIYGYDNNLITGSTDLWVRIYDYEN